MNKVLKVLGWLSVPYVMVGVLVSKKYNNKMYGVIAGIGALMVLLAVGSASGTTGINNINGAAREDLELLSLNSQYEDYVSYATGEIRNNTNKTYSYVQVEINFLDENENIIGSTLANVNNLRPGATWRFKAVNFYGEYAKFRVEDITGF
jgi:hypothetical protein